MKPEEVNTNEASSQQLEQTQKQLSRLQQLNKSLQVQLQQERKNHPQVCWAVMLITLQKNHLCQNVLLFGRMMPQIKTKPSFSSSRE